MANKHGALTSFAKCSAMPQAKPNPSYVDVPRPNSSMITNDFSVAERKMDADSSISAMNVETPRN